MMSSYKNLPEVIIFLETSKTILLTDYQHECFVNIEENDPNVEHQGNQRF